MDPITMGFVALSAGKAIHDMRKSDQLNEQAEKRTRKALTRLAEAQVEQKQAEAEMQQEALRLVNRKKAIITTSMNSFLQLYDRIMKINFTDSEGIRELDYFTPAINEEIRSQITYVRTIDKAPTVTKNVMTGYLLGGVVGAITSSIVDDAKRNLDLARIYAKQADAITTQTQTYVISYQAVTDRIKMITTVLTKLNILFMKGIQYSNDLIDKNGTDKKKYSLEERKSLAACVNLAGAVKAILDVPIIDKEGTVTQKSLEAIQKGEQCLADISFAMTKG